MHWTKGLYPQVQKDIITGDDDYLFFHPYRKDFYQTTEVMG